jgi:hypothetical protein
VQPYSAPDAQRNEAEIRGPAWVFFWTPCSKPIWQAPPITIRSPDAGARSIERPPPSGQARIVHHAVVHVTPPLVPFHAVAQLGEEPVGAVQEVPRDVDPRTLVEPVAGERGVLVDGRGARGEDVQLERHERTSVARARTPGDRPRCGTGRAVALPGAAVRFRSPSGRDAGAPEQTSITSPPVRRNSDF